MVRTITIAIDKQEKRPVRFPVNFHRGPHLYKVCLVRKSLRDRAGKPAGDYRCLSTGFADVLIERKSDPSELYKCFLGGERERVRAQLKRLAAACKWPVLLIDSTPAEVVTCNYRQWVRGAPDHCGELIVQQVVDACLEFGLQLVWAQRVDTGPRELMLGRLVLALLTSPQVVFSNVSEKSVDRGETCGIVHVETQETRDAGHPADSRAKPLR